MNRKWLLNVKKALSVIFVFLALGFLHYSLSYQEAKIKEENGVTVVYNPRKPVSQPGGPIKLEYTKLYPDRKIPDIKKPPPHYPKHFPLFRSLICDDEGRLFVQTWDRADNDNFWHDVFDADGRYIYRFPHPDVEVISVIKKNKAYCMIRANEEGIPLIKRYTLTWE